MATTLSISPQHFSSTVALLVSELAALQVHVVGSGLPVDALTLLGKAQGRAEFLRQVIEEAQ